MRRGPTAALLLVLVVASRANAQAVDVRGDPGLDARKLESLVALELGRDAARVTRVAIDVQGRSAVVTVVMGAETRAATVAIGETEPERGVALFVGEVARGEAPSTPAPAPAPAPTPSTSTSTSTSEKWGGAAGGEIGARVMTTHGALLVTPRLELAARIAGFRIGVTARYGYASADDALGTARAHLFAGGIAVTDRVFKRGVFGLGTGPRLELGGIAGQGDGANGTSRSALTVAGSWAVELRAELAPVTLFVAGDVGVSRGLVLQADARDVLHVSGPFVGAASGFIF